MSDLWPLLAYALALILIGAAIGILLADAMYERRLSKSKK